MEDNTISPGQLRQPSYQSERTCGMRRWLSDTYPCQPEPTTVAYKQDCRVYVRHEDAKLHLGAFPQAHLEEAI